MAVESYTPSCCWVTLVTKATYLPGVIILAYSLSLQKSKYPLIVLVTPSLPRSALHALESESVHNPNLQIRKIDHLKLPQSQKTTLIAQRFEDTWTKLRAFELTTYDTCIFLDGDIAIYRNMDELFDMRLPSHDWIAACHACVCNLDHDSWAPANWTRRNCPYTSLSHPSALHTANPTPENAGPPNTHALLNGGVFLYHPSPTLWKKILHYFNTSPELSTFMFPDQDFLAAFFVHKWIPLSWKYNAIKTMRQWHTNIWRDDEVKALHYIVDKPWARRTASDGIAGHMGRDGVTHSWWWSLYQRWRDQRCDQHGRTNGFAENSDCDVDIDLVKILDDAVAPELDAEADRKQCRENREEGFPVPIPTDQDEKEDSGLRLRSQPSDQPRGAMGITSAKASNGTINGHHSHSINNGLA